MRLHTIDTGYFKLDGGAMFGVVPKVMWQKFYPADANNLCTWAMRCLLIEHGNRLILIDTGIGDKQSEKFFSHFHPHGEASLLGSIQQKGYSPDDITDVILTHLHFDHVGGAVSKVAEHQYRPTFKNATYWSQSDHWKWALTPNPREKASFLRENFVPLEESGQLKFIDQHDWDIPEIDFRLCHGHTESQIIPQIQYKGQTIVYCADLMPSPHHLPLPYVMAYDIRPLTTLEERKSFLSEAVGKDWILYYEHDAKVECSKLIETPKGVRYGETFALSELG
ncbi:MAG: MBL fold metallo-hydrolase [Saprospiraceae bacterium]|nr:MBL fold metallo-hydrolase [Saprospiraceae bacterium]